MVVGGLVKCVGGAIRAVGGLVKCVGGAIWAVGGLVKCVGGAIQAVGGLVKCVGGAIWAVGSLVEPVGGAIQAVGGLVKSVCGLVKSVGGAIPAGSGGTGETLYILAPFLALGLSRWVELAETLSKPTAPVLYWRWGGQCNPRSGTEWDHPTDQNWAVFDEKAIDCFLHRLPLAHLSQIHVEGRS